MGSVFNPLILEEKLAKLNSSQQSIETLSHWCIFHMNKAKQVVETWDRQYHCSPREQRLAFLYLANDILQNSRRKGAEFVGEFWKVLPDAFRDTIRNGDEFARNAALRLISIWDERKVFGSRGQILKDEFVGRDLDISNRNSRPSGMRLRPTAGNAVEKIVSSYQLVYGGQLDEDSVLNKCKNAIKSIEKVDKEIGGDLRSGHHNGSAVVDDLKGQHATLRDCIEQLTSVELSRANLVANLREALQEQEYKLDQVRSQLQAAHAHSDQAEDLCRQLSSGNNSDHISSEHGQKENHVAHSHDFVSGSKGQSSPVMYTRQVPFDEKCSSSSSKDDTKAAAAAMAAKLTASPSSAEMLTYVLSSLASEGVIGNNQIKDGLSDFPPEKRLKLDNDKPPPYIPSQSCQPPIPSFPHSESVPQHTAPPTCQDLTSNEQPPPPSAPPPVAPLPPPMHPYPVPQYIPTVGTIPNGAYSYGPIQQPPPSLPDFPPVGPTTNGVAPFSAPAGNMYQSYPTDGSFYSQAPSLPTAPVSRQ